MRWGAAPEWHGLALAKTLCADGAGLAHQVPPPVQVIHAPRDALAEGGRAVTRAGGAGGAGGGAGERRGRVAGGPR